MPRLTALVLAVCFSTLCWLLAPSRGVAETAADGRVEPRDFVEYWAAARLVAQRGNPYDPEQVLEVERAAGWRATEPLLMWNPPWVIPLLIPFGYLSFATGQFFWLLLHVGALLVAARWLWVIYDPGGLSSRLAWIFTFTFVPVVFVLVLGQITPLVVIGAACFPYALRQGRIWLAGAALVFLALKPHLLYLLWIVLALWIWEKRAWTLLRACLTIGAAAALLPLLLDPQIYAKYLALYNYPEIPKPLDWPAPTLRNVLRIFFGIERAWLQLAPTAAAVLWAVLHWRRHRKSWRWEEQLPLVSLVSVASGFFVWTYDHVVVLPALLHGAVAIVRGPRPWHRWLSAQLYLAVNAVHGLLRFWLAEELWYFWLAPALLVNYLLFLRERGDQAAADLPPRARRVQ
jgi:hypothetical protein